MPAPADTPFGWWHCRAMDDNDEPRWLAVNTNSTPDGDEQRVDLPESDASALVGDHTVCLAYYHRGQIAKFTVAAHMAPKAPPMWFAELPEPDASPPAVCLVAF